MPEGPECLIVAEAVQRWAAERGDAGGLLGLYLSPRFDRTMFRHSPMDADDFNRIYGKLDCRRVSTFGKVIFLPSDTGHCLSAQLGMTGTFTDQEDDHTRAKFYAHEDEYQDSPLCYSDIRKFGNLMLFREDAMPRNMSVMMRNAVDWRDPEAPAKLADRIYKRKDWADSEIKPLLMNQALVAGIGNIYACEALFRAGIHPRRRVMDLSEEEIARTMSRAQEIMNQSYALGGMTVRTFSSFGRSGNASKLLKIYDKVGFTCTQCRMAFVQRILQKGRNTYFCPQCQSR